MSIYSHRAQVHDGITKVAGSLNRSLAAIRFLKARGLRVLIANVLMRQNAADYPGVQALARELGVECTIDPTITPKMDGDTSVVALRVPRTELLRVFTDRTLVGEAAGPLPPAAFDSSALDDVPCSAGHTSCYISPYGDIYPCVQFPLPSGMSFSTAILPALRAHRGVKRSSPRSPPGLAKRRRSLPDQAHVHEYR